VRAIVTTVALFLAATAAAGQPVEKTRKNIKVLMGLPESQLFPAMNFIGDSLGVHCDYCHVKAPDRWMWESDDKPQKRIGREMIRMVLAMNQEHFDGTRKLTCYTCHRGNTQVATFAPLPPRDFVKERAALVATPVPAPAEIVARYMAAIGGASATKTGTAVMKASVERASGPATVEIVMKRPDKLLITVTTEKSVVKQGPPITPDGC
jgi:hypothetical protein